MEDTKNFLRDRLVLLLVTVTAVLLAIGVLSVLIRFDVTKNPTIVVAYRPNVSGSAYESGKSIDIYSLAIFMILTAATGVGLSAKVYRLRRSMAVLVLAATGFLLLLSVIVANALVSLQ